MSAVPNSIFGTDLLFNGDLVVNGKGDYTEVNDEENLRRAIIRRLITNLGEYKRVPTYGCGLQSKIKKGMTKSMLDELRHGILDNLARERRLDKVLTLTLTPTFYGDQPALDVLIVVQAKGRVVRFRPLTFTPKI